MDGNIVSGSQVGGVAVVLIRWYLRNVCSGGGDQAGMGGLQGPTHSKCILRSVI